MKLVNRSPLFSNSSSSSSGFSSSNKSFKKIFAILIFLAGIGGLIFAFGKMNVLGKAPTIDIAAGFIGKTGKVLVSAKSESGVCRLSVTLSQETKNVSLLEITGDKNNKELSKEGAGDLLAHGFTEGVATLNSSANDCSLFKRTFKSSKEITLDFLPPRIELTSSQHYINQGGADVVTYHVSSDAVTSGVEVGPNFFKGYTKPGSAPENGDAFAFIVYSYDLPANTPLTLVASDSAGNTAKATFAPAKFFPKEFRKRELPIEDKFIATKVHDIISNTPGLKSSGDNLQDFLLVNRDLRKQNADYLKELSEKSEPRFFWKDVFKPLGNAAIEASFADYRSYMYQGQKVDEQVHLGFDMAVTERYPIVASGAGKIIYADYLGIYGNMVLIDHGYGLVTLYGHLSQIDVQVGQIVARDEKIGNSGATGLAGGDHLHFSMLIQGVQTNPVEFWDPHWIADHVVLRLGKLD